MTNTPASDDYSGSGKQAAAWGLAGAAGFLLAMVGGFQILQGIAALVQDTVYVVGIEYIYKLDLATWGWIHLILGIIALGTGIGLLYAQTWARVIGIVVAVLGALLNFAFIPYYPFWAIIILAFYVAVIWALSVQLAHNDRNP